MAIHRGTPDGKRGVIAGAIADAQDTSEGQALQKAVTDYLAQKPVPTELKGSLR